MSVMRAPRSHSAGLLSRTVHLRAAHPADIWLGERLRRRRKERGLSLTDVARRSGLSIGLISQVERGISAPSARALRAISKSLGLTSKAGRAGVLVDLTLSGQMMREFRVRKTTRLSAIIGLTGEAAIYGSSVNAARPWIGLADSDAPAVDASFAAIVADAMRRGERRK